MASSPSMMHTAAGRCAPCPRTGIAPASNLGGNRGSQLVVPKPPWPQCAPTTPLRDTACFAASPASTETQQPSSSDLIPSLIAFLKEDLPHLFDDQGIDVSKYDPEVEFEDPITKYSSLQGYLLNIQFLRRVFDPTLTLHDARQSGPYEITTRWTMTMTPTFTAVLGPLRRWWNPTLTFTGTSIMGVNPATGRFNRHADTWDAIQQQRFFSTEAFTHMLSQVADFRRTPQDLASPQYTVLKKLAAFEVRDYPGFTVAEAPLDAARTATGAAASSVGPASSGFRAFNDLAGYIFGGNAAGERMAMTTPVFSDSLGKMAFFLGPAATDDLSALPRPKSDTVSLKREQGGVFAVATFSGLALEGDAAKEVASLRAAVAAAGMETVGDYWVLARYNDPGVLPPFRRNEVMVPLQNFKLW